LVSDTGEPLFGIMFDDADREGFAVAPSTTAHKFSEREPGSVPTLQLRTFVHELLHALNRRHLDAMQMGDGRLTLEAPTRCISGQQRGEWFLQEAPLMEISPQTIRFFQTASRSDVLPGKENSAYQYRRGSPTECEDARANVAGDSERSRWQLAGRRLRELFSIQSASAAENAEPAEIETETVSVDLRVQALPAAYPLGYPIAVRITAKNSGEQPLPIKDRLIPAYGMVRIEYRAVDTADWSTLKPLAWFEPASDEDAMLAAGETTEQTVPIYFGDDGWTFKVPGDYEVRARIHTGNEGDGVVSEPVSITIGESDTTDDLAALQPLLDDRGRLRNDVGRLLTFGGRIGSEKDIAPLKEASQNYGHTALGAALRLTLISQRLRAPIDARTGERPAPDLSDARELLKDTCTDSGIAALKYQLLLRHAGAIPDNLSNQAETAIAAWDGTTSARGNSIATYSDPSLSPWGPSMHFCFNDAELHGPARSAAQRAVRELRRAKPARVVVVGHGDYQGTCRYNDALALRRAQTVRRMLIDAGIRSSRIQVASLGERRPLDFASTTQAHDLNRRVEILVEAAKTPANTASLQQRLLPKCSAEPAVPTTQGIDLTQEHVSAR
jgi:outer membrane protein OmpA-like peptidoglycan-associated protein